MKILGITPARGGSKGIFKKNIKLLAGKPLICHTIEQALKSQLIDTYIVSTENLEIDTIARKCGATVLERPAEFAQDTSSTLSVVQHALETIENEVKVKYDIVVLLQCTSPIRGDYLIDYCISQFLLHKPDSLVTGYMCKNIPYNKENQEKRRQDIKPYFVQDGNVYVVSVDLIRNGDFVGNKVSHIITTNEENVDIDDNYDFWLADQIILKKGN